MNIPVFDAATSTVDLEALVLTDWRKSMDEAVSEIEAQVFYGNRKVGESPPTGILGLEAVDPTPQYIMNERTRKALKGKANPRQTARRQQRLNEVRRVE